MTRLLAVQPCNAAGKLQAVYLSRRKQNHAQFARPCLGLFDDPLTTQPRKKGALFPMQSMQPLSGKARLFVMPSSENEPRKLVLRGPVCYAVNLSRAAQRQPSPTRNHAGQPIPHAVKTAPVEGRATRQCSAAQYGATQPRRNGSMQRVPTPHSPGRAVPGGLCKFAQNRAVKALQIRPISTTRNALQEPQAAISNGLAAFQSTPGNAARRNPDRRQRLTPSDYVRLA